MNLKKKTVNTEIYEKCQLQSQLPVVQSWEKSEELLLPIAQTAVVQTPIYMGHLKHNTSKDDLIPHLSVDSMNE